LILRSSPVARKAYLLLNHCSPLMPSGHGSAPRDGKSGGLHPCQVAYNRGCVFVPLFLQIRRQIWHLRKPGVDFGLLSDRIFWKLADSDERNGEERVILGFVALPKR
jgi:hypothetical protein